MTVHIEILGDEEHVLYKHLNKQYSTQKRLILTKDVLLHSFEGDQLLFLFQKLMNSPPDSYYSHIQTARESGLFDGVLKNELYKNIQERLGKISSNLDIQLKDYNFMSSISNARFTVVLRCDQFSFRVHFQEKGALMSSIRTLIEKYLDHKGNVYRLSRLDKFQIEIFESEEVYKHVYLKKEDNKLMLYSGFGFLNSETVDYSSGGEFYFSIGEDFTFYKNKQQFAQVREGNSIVEREIHEQEKVLSNNELVAINNQTKHLSDVAIEGYLTQKGAFKITDVSLVETIPSFHSEDGFVIHKSSKNYNKISLVLLKDDLSEQSANPNYVLIRNPDDLKELVSLNNSFKYIDGIVLTFNGYYPFLDHLGEYFDIDVIYFGKLLSKTLETTLSWTPFSIEGASEQTMQEANPFASIIQEEKKEKDALLEKLKNIDLSTPVQTQEQTAQNQNIQNLAEGLISSPQASTRKSAMNWPTTPGNIPGQKKSAMQMLADVALNKPEPAPQPPAPTAPVQAEPVQQPIKSDFVMEDVHASDLQPLTQETLDKTAGQLQEAAAQKENLSSALMSKYEDILATKVLTPPTVVSSGYLTDSNTISQVQNDAEIFFVTTKVEEGANSSLKYVVPVTIEDQIAKADYLLINRLEDFFLINDSKAHNKRFFINLTQLSPEMKERALKEGLSKVGNISVILFKQDLGLIADNIDKINEVFVKDLTSQEEAADIEAEILRFEKKHLMRKI